MDIFISTRWLFTILGFVLLFECEEAMGSGRICPQGQLEHQQEVDGRNTILTCCKPTRCGVGQQVNACTINGTMDTCTYCQHKYNQSQRTSSFTMERCTYVPLNSECKPEPYTELISDEDKKRCFCNIEEGVKYEPPETEARGAPINAYCQQMKRRCQKGYEPNIKGKCQPCKDHYFKSTISFNLCEPKVNCSMLGLEYTFKSFDKTADHNCSEPEPVTTPRPIQTVKPPHYRGRGSKDDHNHPVKVHPPTAPPVKLSSSPTTTMEDETVRTGASSKGSSPRGSSTDSNMWHILAPVLFLLVLLILIMAIMCYRKKRGMTICLCDSDKNVSDAEKYNSNRTTSVHIDPRNKHSYSNGVIHQHYSSGDKIVNNNINGGMHLTQSSPHVRPQLNGEVSGLYSNPGHDNIIYSSTSQPQNTYYTVAEEGMGTNGRPGILRNGHNSLPKGQRGRPEQPVYAQAAAYSHHHAAGPSLDSIAREKLHVNINGMEANQDIGENDPLLIGADSPHLGVGHVQGFHDNQSQFQNIAVSASPNNSPPIPVAGMNPVRYVATTGAAVGPPNVAYIPSSGLTHSATPPTTQVTFGPSGVVTFTRSTSVIASPEGEVDEEEMEALVPRFSQLLPDANSSSVSTSVMEPTNPILRMLRDRDTQIRSDSPMRETTQQLRHPNDRINLHNQGRSPYNNGNYQSPIHNRAVGGMGPPVPPVRHPSDHEELPEHCIMDLKEQQLAESLHNSVPSSPVQSDTQPKTVLASDDAFSPNPATTDGRDALKQLNVNSESDQTDVKKESKRLHKEPSNINSGASAEQKTVKSECNLDLKPSKNVDCSHVVSEKSSKGGTVGNSSTLERKRVPSGGSNCSDQSPLERQRMPSGDQHHRSCLKSQGIGEDAVLSSQYAKRQLQPNIYGRTVSFEEEEAAGVSTARSQAQISDSKQNGSSSNSNSQNGHKQTLASRSVSDSEDNKCEPFHTGLTCDHEGGQSSGSKSSINSDISSSGSNHSSPSKAKVYRRSQSDNAASNGSSPQVMPRSISEEKQQKLGRPIAKVKPMTASDNRLPVEVSDDTHVVQQSQAAHHTGRTTGNVMDYSSEDSDSEDVRRGFEESGQLEERDSETDDDDQVEITQV